MAEPACCLKGFEWEGTPTGRIEKLGHNDTYVTGDNPDAAVMIIHDLFGWTFPNIRLLADQYAQEMNATVYVPDFFAGEVLPFEPLIKSRWHEIDLQGFMSRNSREVREPEIFDCARALREKFKKIGAVGFCYGGWAVFRLSAKEHQPPLVDCVTAGHPSRLTRKDIDDVAVPVQILAPELDPVYNEELKMHSFSVIRTLGVPFDYEHFPGAEHACFVRGDPDVTGEREAMVKGKYAAVNWHKQFLHDM